MSTLIKVCQFLYYTSKVGITACGIVIALILAVISLAKLQGVVIDAKLDFNATTSGWYPYLWICLIVLYATGCLVIMGKWLKNKLGPNGK